MFETGPWDEALGAQAVAYHGISDKSTLVLSNCSLTFGKIEQYSKPSSHGSHAKFTRA
jgi:hypothetical protein